MKIAIIGAGVAGLATAARLASKGHEVHVFEANSYAGGKLSEFSLAVEGEKRQDALRIYRFDAGPSLFTMPQYIEDLFKAADVPINDYFSYSTMPDVCHYFWQDGTALTAWADQDKFAEEVQNKLNIKPLVVKKTLADAKRKYDLTGVIFLENSLHKAKTWLTAKVLKSLILMPTFDIFKTMNATHERLAEGHSKFVQLLNRFATYNGSNPYRASGMLSVIPHFEHGIGCFYPVGGMNTITQAVYNLGKTKGVQFHFNALVKEIIVENGQAKGLKVLNQEQRFDRIVSNMDVYFTYKKLLPHEKHPDRTLNQERSTSALIFYWGVKQSFPQLGLHNIFFSDNYKQEFDALERGDVGNDPTIYVNITSKLTPTDAPDACENWFVLINVPHNQGQDWQAITARTRKIVIKKMSKALNIDFQKLIEVEAILDPLSIEAKTASFSGALYGTSSNALMSAFMRHPNFSSSIEGLYFVGGSVHPGGGIPLALLSAKIVDDNFK
ncbi:MAG: 1-hydroxycarotenoid 3,4-desaturase CrtD [Saprospiraceae bacterium]|nr:1-hydroxycarotenoid 3,4-desaturase CrtD [Saprospiraceae bacterium]